MDQQQQPPQVDISNHDIQPDPSIQPADSISTETVNQLIVPIQPTNPSTMHVNDLPDDCISLILEKFETLQDLVEKAFVCPRWVNAVYLTLGTRQHSLKVFDSDRNIETYEDLVLLQMHNLIKLHPNAGVKQTGDKQEDHILLRSLSCDNIEDIIDILVQLFSKVKNLVLQTLHTIDHAKLLQGMNHLTSVTLVELPDSRQDQNRIWEALSQCPALCHVYIFYINGFIPFTVEKMDFLPRLQNFTLDSYDKRNLNEILNRLSSDQCRSLQIGPLSYGVKVLRKLIYENPQLVTSLTHLTVRLTETTRTHFRRTLLGLICSKFKALTFLDLEFAHLWYGNVLKRLTELPNLVEIRFPTQKCIQWNNPDLRMRHWPGINFYQLDHQLSPLPNIRFIYLTKKSFRTTPEDYKLILKLFPHPEDITDFHGPLIDLFPCLERVTYVLNNIDWMGEGLDGFRRFIRQHINQYYYQRVGLLDAAVGTFDDNYFTV